MSEFTLEHKEPGPDLEVVLPQPNELQIDCDNDAAFGLLHRAVDLMNSHGFQAAIDKTTYSKSGNRHVTVQVLRDITDTERIALQACLGSDPIRELLSLLRVFNGIENPSRLFEKKKSKKAAK